MPHLARATHLHLASGAVEQNEVRFLTDRTGIPEVVKIVTNAGAEDIQVRVSLLEGIEGVKHVTLL
jgi:hypothetical protein